MQITIAITATIFVKVPVFPNKAPKAAKVYPIAVINAGAILSIYPDSKFVLETCRV